MMSASTSSANSDYRSHTPAAVAWSVAVLIVATTLFVYLPAKNYGFIDLDDADYVSDNRLVQAGLTWEGIKWAFTTGHSSNWHPVTWLSHMLDAQLFGAGSVGPHVMNVLLHATNALLLFAFLLRITGAFWRSSWVSAVFALHPLRLESVAWIAERKDVLSSFFFLLTVCAYIHYVAASPAENSKQKLWYACTLGLFALGLMSKPMLVTLPCVLLLLDHWPLGRLRIETLRELPTRLAPLLREKTPFFLLSGLSCVATCIAQKNGGALRSLTSFSATERIENALVAYAGYLGKLLWPVDLSIYYPHPGYRPVLQVALSAIVLAGLCLGAWRLRTRLTFAATGWFWFLGMLVPTIGLVQVGNQAMADRYTYLPSIGVLIIIAWGTAELCARWKSLRPIACLVAVLTVIACIAQTRASLKYWQSSETLFRHALAVTKDNFAAHNSLGYTLLVAGRIDEAVAEFQKTLELQPDLATAHNNLGNAFLKKQQTNEAISHFQKALELQPNLLITRYNLGTTLLQSGRTDEAIEQLEILVASFPDHAWAHLNLGNAFLQKNAADQAITHYERALAIRPNFAEAHSNLGYTLVQKDRIDEAMGHLQRALEINPSQANAHYHLGNVLLQQGHLDEAIAHFQKALISSPRDADTHNSLGFAFLRKGQIREAIAKYETSLQIQPENIGTLANLSWILATCPEPSLRNGKQAVNLARRASQLSNHQDPAVLHNLAAAYAEAGEFPQAISTAQQALQLAEGPAANPALAAILRDHLKSYQAGIPLRDAGLVSAPNSSTSP